MNLSRTCCAPWISWSVCAIKHVPATARMAAMVCSRRVSPMAASAAFAPSSPTPFGRWRDFVPSLDAADQLKIAVAGKGRIEFFLELYDAFRKMAKKEMVRHPRRLRISADARARRSTMARSGSVEPACVRRLRNGLSPTPSIPVKCSTKDDPIVRGHIASDAVVHAGRRSRLKPAGFGMTACGTTTHLLSPTFTCGPGSAIGRIAPSPVF